MKKLISFLVLFFLLFSISMESMATSASIGNKVWNDLNANGIQNGGEPPFEGVVVNLYDCNDNFKESKTTNAWGEYRFYNLIPGDYYVEFILPSGCLFSPQHAGANWADSDAGSDGKTECTTLDHDEYDHSWDCGLVQVASLGNRVWEDLNVNGKQDGGEPPLEGVVVNLYDCNDNLKGSRTTNAYGEYRFFNIPAGDYYVEFILLTDYFYSPKDNSSCGDATDSDAGSDGKTDCFTLEPGEDDCDWDCGMWKEEDGTTIAASKTANAIFDRTWNWEIDKTVQPEELHICEGDIGMANFTVSVTKISYTDVVTVTGQVCVDNTGDDPTEGLTIGDTIQYKTSTSGWTPVPGAITEITPAQLAIGDCKCYDYSFIFDAIEDAEYRNVAGVTITNYLGHQGTPHGKWVCKEFSLPADLNSEINATIHVNDTHGQSWTFDDDGSETYEVGYACNDQASVHTNTATIEETGQYAEATVTINCYDLAVAEFTAEPTSGISPLEVQFTDLSTDAIKWLWDFGDGTTSEEQHPVHVFYNPPRKHFTITLTVWGFCEDTDTITKEGYITAYKEAYAAFNGSPIVGPPELVVQFSNNCGGLVNNFRWDYGDGETETLMHNVMDKVHPQHVYPDEGEYTVSLKAWGQGGEDMLTIPGMIYVDSDYAPLEWIEGSAVVADKYDWDKAIDHDIISDESRVLAINDGAWAIFKMDTTRKVHKVRMLANTALGATVATNLVKDFEILVSCDGVDFTSIFNGTVENKDEWMVFEFDPAEARFVKLSLINARGEDSPYVSLCEFQVFGENSFAAAVTAMENGNSKTLISAEVPEEFGLSQNYPNPFNPETVITFQLPEASDVVLTIHNIRGQVITTLVNANKDAGVHQVMWNGKDSAGKEVAGGMYIYNIRVTNAESETFSRSHKMMFMK